MADNLQMLGASMDKANSIDDTPVMDIDGAELQPEDASVRFEDVSFSYGERTILDHVSLTVPSGSTTAVVGPSGGGKTTLCNLIARFWDVQGGRITVGGHDVAGVQAGQPDEEHLHGVPVGVSLQRHGGEQHQVRPPGRHP